MNGSTEIEHVKIKPWSLPAAPPGGGPSGPSLASCQSDKGFGSSRQRANRASLLSPAPRTRAAPSRRAAEERRRHTVLSTNKAPPKKPTGKEDATFQPSVLSLQRINVRWAPLFLSLPTNVHHLTQLRWSAVSPKPRTIKTGRGPRWRRPHACPPTCPPAPPWDRPAMLENPKLRFSQPQKLQVSISPPGIWRKRRALC